MPRHPTSLIGETEPRQSGFEPWKSIGRQLMVEQALPDEFREFLKLLTEADVEYLLIGGYAVGYHGYPRTTADMDVWVAVSPRNAARLVDVFRRFGMQDPRITPSLFQERGKIIRMGVPPMRIEVLTEIDGVSFAECYDARITAQIDGQAVQLISREHLRLNKLASGRHKDLDDLEHLPED